MCTRRAEEGFVVVPLEGRGMGCLATRWNIALHCITMVFVALHCITMVLVALHCITMVFAAFFWSLQSGDRKPMSCFTRGMGCLVTRCLFRALVIPFVELFFFFIFNKRVQLVIESCAIQGL